MNSDSIHKIAKKMGVNSKKNAHFEAWCNYLIGKTNLNDMTDAELVFVYNQLKYGKYTENPLHEVLDSNFLIDEIKDEFGLKTNNVKSSLNECTIVGAKH